MTLHDFITLVGNVIPVVNLCCLVALFAYVRTKFAALRETRYHD